MTIILIPVKTIEKVLLGLQMVTATAKYRCPLNGGQNYSTSREVIFGTLKTDCLIEADHLIQV